MTFKITKIPTTETVWDITVEKTHTFTVGENNTVVHNCFLLKVDDSVQGLIDHSSEERWLSVLGGGVGTSWSDVRSVSDKSPGPIPFLHTIDADMEAYKQGKSRRGSYAAYMDISHPDIVEFINIRVPTGDISRKCHSSGFHNAVNISDDFMEAVIHDLDWDLINPADKKVVETVKARELWNLVLETRYRTGEPYICYIDTANRALPFIQRQKGLKVNNSNLCVTGDTIISVKINEDEQEIRMDSLVENFKDFNSVQVKSYDVDNSEFKWSDVSAAAQTGVSEELIEITTENGNIIICTEDHQIYTKNRGWVKAKDLLEDDELVEEKSCG